MTDLEDRRLDHRLAESIAAQVLNERVRAHLKHKNSRSGSMEQKPWDHPIWLAVVTEEIGEIARELCERDLGNAGRIETRENLYVELIQSVAMLTAWIAAIEIEDG